MHQYYRSFKHIYRNTHSSNIKYWFTGGAIVLLCVMFLPWTQNISARGSVTTLQQKDRPQEINSPIGGKIMKWWIKEGDFVKAGDTILQLSEVKSEYLDPNLVSRTQRQLDAKLGTIGFYKSKVLAYDAQIKALIQGRILKIKQLENKLVQLNSKLKAEQAELKAATNEYNLSADQYERQKKMFSDGLVSQTQLQQRDIAVQNAQSKMQVIENKIAQTQQEIMNNHTEQQSAQQEYEEKINKAESERLQSLSQIATSEGEIAKLENVVTNYNIRNAMYFVLAPQDGQIVQAKKSGVGEIVKENEHITMIVPNHFSHAVEMFIRPIDLPLINIGQEVRFMFDGFPTIVFRGWPQASYGTFTGKIVAYENSIGPNGLFRVLVAEDDTKKKWPPQLKIGTGAQAITLLNDVPVWYELWRNINGFPPDFYVVDTQKTEKKK